MLKPIGQRPPDVLVGFAPHDQAVTQGDALEHLLLAGDAPRDGSGMADDPVSAMATIKEIRIPGRFSIFQTVPAANDVMTRRENRVCLRCYNRSHAVSRRQGPSRPQRQKH